MRLYTTFYFGEHFCLVLELLNSSLIHHIMQQIQLTRALPPPPASPQPEPPILMSSPETPTTTSTSISTPSKKRDAEVLNLQDTPNHLRPSGYKRKSRAQVSHDESPAKKDKKDRVWILFIEFF